MKKPETKLQQRMMNFLSKKNVYYINTNDSGEGDSDIVACLFGYFVALEVKNKSLQRGIQKFKEIRVRSSLGGYYLVNDIRELETIYNKYKEKKRGITS